VSGAGARQGQAGLKTIPALVVTLSDRESAEWGLAENIQREDLNPIETAQALRTLQREFGLTQTEIGERVGLDRSSVANTLRVLELEDELQSLVAKGALSPGHAKALLGAAAGAKRVDLGRRAADEGWSVRKLEGFVRDASGVEATPAGARSNGAAPARDSLRDDLEKRIGEKLGTRVHLKLHPDRKRGRLIIEFYDLDHFDGLLERFGCRD
jgi:ParB family transcriptional regulator, chromosome partitioning protein